MDTKHFSVSMCVYGKDNPVYFKQAVDSVLNQTVKPTEIVLVVDGPIPEDLNNVVTFYENNSIFKIIRLEKNQGHGIARRVGLENCSYKLVALMDSDDISEQNRFELQLKKFKENPDLDIVGGNIVDFVNNPNISIGKRVVPESDKEIKAFIKKQCPMNQVSVMFKKESVQKAGGYQDWYCNEDYYLWIRMALAGMKFANVPETLVKVRVGNGQFKRRGGVKYFVSGAKLQCFLLKNKQISLFLFLYNVIIRFCAQVLMPHWLRGIIMTFFRK